jgi:hypothetical protein
MPQLIQQYVQPLSDKNGVTYTVCVYGEPGAEGSWEGWIEFNPFDTAQPVLRTERETTQPDKAALTYWASGLEPLYLEGAFARARPK